MAYLSSCAALRVPVLVIVFDQVRPL